MGYLALLRAEPAFRRLWLGQVVSEIGDWLQFVALVTLFSARGRSAELLAGLFVVQMLPALVWAPLAGIVADRFPRGRIMVVCDLVRALVSLGYLAVRGPEDVALVYALSFVQASLTAFFEPARSAALPQIVSRNWLLIANGLAATTWSAALALGSAAGGFVSAMLGTRAAFVIDALTFVASALLISGLRIPRVARGPAEAIAHARDTFGLHALREGASYLARHRPQAVAAMGKALMGTGGGVVFLFAIYASDVFTPPGGDPSRALGMLYAARGVGALAGPVIFKRVFGESVRSLRNGVQLGLLLAAAGYLALIVATGPLLAALFLVGAHMGESTCWVNSTQLLQVTVPNALQGRVFAVDLAGVTSTTMMSTMLAGALIGHAVTGARGATVMMAGAMVLSAAVWAASMVRVGRRLERAAGEQTQPELREA